MSMKAQARLYHLASMAIAGLLAAMFVNVLTYYGPRIEGALFPVALSTQTEIAIMPSGTQIEVHGILSKYRRCDLISSAAYVSDAAGNRVVAKIAPQGTIKLRPVEKGQPWGPWIIDMPAWFRKATLNVVTVHQCHPLWVTQTKFVQAVIE